MLNKLSGKVGGLLGQFSKYCFSIRTAHKQSIQKNIPVNTDFTRQYLRRLAEEPDYEMKQELRRQEERKKAIEQSLFEMKANDKNPANVVKVKINNSVLNILQKINSEPVSTEATLISQDGEKLANTPFCIFPTPRPIHPFVIGTRRRIPVSFMKMRQAVKTIRSKHLYEAISLMQASKKQSCHFLLKALLQVRRHAKLKNMDDNRLHVAGVMLGKSKRFFKMRFHGKGRAGSVTTDISQVTIKLEERSVEEMFKSMMKGKSPPMLAYLIREKLAQEEVDLDRIRKNSYVLTAKGRQQKKLMLKRKALIKYYEYRKKGVKVPLKIITERIVNTEASKFVEEYKSATTERKQDSYNARLAVYKKNMEKTG